MMKNFVQIFVGFVFLVTLWYVFQQRCIDVEPQ